VHADTVVRARIDKYTKSSRYESASGYGVVDVRCNSMLLLRVANEQRLPYAIQAPRPATIKAMKELEDGKGQRLDDAGDLCLDLDI